MVKREGIATERTARSFVDLSPLFQRQPCLLKMDIEGAEFAAIEAYRAELGKLTALIKPDQVLIRP